MPNNYAPDDTAADFASTVPIPLNGEPWQYGDPVTGVGGWFAPFKRALDMIKSLKLKAGDISIPNTWAALQTFAGGILVTGTATFKSVVSLASTGSGGPGVLNVNSGASIEVNNGGTLHVVSGGTANFDVGALGTMHCQALIASVEIETPALVVDSGGVLQCNGDFDLTGSNVTFYESVNVLADTATTHAVRAQGQRWRCPVFSQNTAVVVDAPAITSKSTEITIFTAAETNRANNITIYQNDGTTVIAVLASATNYVQPDASNVAFGAITLSWSPTGLFWRVVGLSGAFSLSLTAH